MMHPAVVILLVVALAITVVVVMVSRSRRTVTSPLALQEGATRAPSIYEQIRDQLRGSPDKPLDAYKIVTDDPVDESPVRFAPGAKDALLGSGSGGAEWETVVDLIRRINRGDDVDWTAVDAVTAATPTLSNVDQVIDQLAETGLSHAALERFWEVALKSRRTESVKWGLAIGGIGLLPDELEPLLVLAHHPEFTLYAAHVLSRDGTEELAYRRKLVELLPRADQWGLIQLIDSIVTFDDLLADFTVQRDVLLYGMENNDGLSFEVAFTIAKSIDVCRFITESGDDERPRRALCDLFDSLLTEPQPLGGLADLEDWEKLYDAWVAFLEQRALDVKLLHSLRAVLSFVSDDALEWPRKAAERDRIERLWKTKFSVDALRDGLDDRRDGWLTLQMIENHEVRELLPDVRRIHSATPNSQTMSVLAKIGSEADLEALRRSLDSFVDLEARARFPMSTKNVRGAEHKHAWEYALIVGAMARLATPEVVTTITSALSDYDPHVRAAACDAVARLKGELVDDEIRAAVRSRLNDSPDYVSDAARRAAQAHGISN